MNDNFIEYAPIIILILGFIWQYKIFVTPQELERKHREILEECEKKFATHIETKNLEEKLDDMQKKIDMIYDKLIG